MINLIELVETTATGYTPHFRCEASKYYNTKFFVTKMGFDTLFLNKYTQKNYFCPLNPYKVVTC